MPEQGIGSLPKTADIVIIGAGVAGLYSAWRLLEHDNDRQILVVDRLRRTGGRLETDIVKIPGRGTVREEEGAMRFLYTHAHLIRVLSALELCDEIVPFPMIDPKGNNRRFYRGRSFTAADAAKRAKAKRAKEEATKEGATKEGAAKEGLKTKQGIPNAMWSELYDLAPNEQGQNPVDLFGAAFHRVLEHNGATLPDKPTPADWQTIRLDYEWGGRKLNEWQLWGLLRDMGYTEECIVMFSETIGFQGPITLMANAGDAFQILEDFPSNPSFYTLQSGFSILTETLCARIEKLGGTIVLDAELTNVAQNGDEGYRLTFNSPGEDPAGPISGAHARTVTAPQTILGLPFGALQTLFQRSADLSSHPQGVQFWKDIMSVLGMRLMKITLYYDDPWWEDGSIGQPTFQFGASFTDLPLNAVYPFGSITGDPEKSAAALTIYCGDIKINLWEGLQNLKPPFDSELQRAHSAGPRALVPASEAVVVEAKRQLMRLFDVTSLPDPVLTSYRLWSHQNDHGDAYHMWGIGANDREIIPRMIEPLTNLFTAGEAYCDTQAWVNGAMRSADLVLERFGILPIIQDPKIDPCEAPLQPATDFPFYK